MSEVLWIHGRQNRHIAGKSYFSYIQERVGKETETSPENGEGPA